MTDVVLRVLHLTGSAVSPLLDDLSRLYAADCLAATADPERYETHVAHVSPGGAWRFPSDLAPASLAAAEPVSGGRALERIGGLGLDVVVPQMFCLPGMTAYRAIGELLGVPVVGNPPATMALAAHKGRARAVVAAAGVDVPAGEVLRRGGSTSLPLPVVVKPVDSDNSVGVALVRDAADLPGALAAAYEHADEVLVETYVPLGREVRCGVLEVDGELRCLPLEEYAVDERRKPVRDRADKLSRSDGGDLALVAKDAEHAWIVDPSDPLTDAVQAVARLCFRALGCRDHALFDFRVDPTGRVWFLEAGLYCSFAEQSVLVVMARAAGTSLPDLFRTSLEQATARGSSAQASTEGAVL